MQSIAEKSIKLTAHSPAEEDYNLQTETKQAESAAGSSIFGTGEREREKMLVALPYNGKCEYCTGLSVVYLTINKDTLP